MRDNIEQVKPERMGTNRKHITDIDDIKHLVDSFYAKVRADAYIGPIFDTHIEDRWPAHLEKMYRFWETVLLGANSYSGRPFTPHFHLPIDGAHFGCWLILFDDTVDQYFVGSKAEEAKWRAAKMAEMFQTKLEQYRENSDRTPL